MIVPPRKGAPRRPWLGLLALLIVAIALWLQRGTPTQAPGTRAAERPPAAAPAREAAPRTDDAPVIESAPDARAFGSDVGFRSRERWMEHWQKHGREFADLGIRDADAYLAAAQTLRDEPAGGDVLETTRNDGVTTRFDRTTGSFLAFNRDGTIRTFFRPNDGEAYFRRQAQREH